MARATLTAVVTQDSSEDLCRTHYARVLRLCRLLLADPHEAEETAEEVFLKLVHAHQAQTPIRSWAAWLTRVAVNACRDRRRSAWWKWGRVPPAQFQAEALLDKALTPEEAAIDREAHERLWRAVRALATRQCEVFALHLEGWSHAEAATLLGITTGSVKRHLFHAVRHLRKALGEHP